MFTKNDKKEILESLSRYRNASDKLSDDIFNLSSKLIGIIESFPAHDVRTPEVEAAYQQVAGMLSDVLQATLDANQYTDSLYKDYTKAIKRISAAKEISDAD